MSDTVILRFSDLVENDGGFDLVKAEFIKFGEEMKAEAAKIKKDLANAFSFDDVEGLAKIEARIEALQETMKEYAAAKKNLEKIEKEYTQALKDQADADIKAERVKQAKLTTIGKEFDTTAKLSKAIKAENDEKKSNISLTDAAARSSEKAARQKERETSEYLKLTAELNASFRASANLGAQMVRLELAGLKATPAYAKLAAQFTASQQGTLKLDKAVKDLEVSLGRSQRKVGDYASGFNPLNNSVSQIVRELPSISGGFAIFASAIGNNIAPLKDAIDGIQAQNKILAAEGKATQSVFKSLVGSIFSFNTALIVGVTLLTVYGKEIGEFAKSLFGANEQLKMVAENQDKLNKANIEGLKASVEAETKLKELLNIAGDPNLPLIDREIALKKLRSEYPYYFRNLTDEQILAGKTAEAEAELRKAIEKRQEANRLSDVIVSNKQRLLDIKAETDALKKQSKDAEDAAKRLAKQDFVRPEALAGLGEQSAAALKKIKMLADEKEKIDKQNADNEGKILQLRKESIGLDYQEEKNQKAKLINQIKTVDYLASEFELRKAEVSNRIKTNEEIFGSDKYTVEQRLNAQKLLVSDLERLAVLERNNSLRELKLKYDKERTETIKDSDGKFLAMKYSKQGLLELEKQYGYDVLKVQEDFRQAMKEANEKGERVAYLETLDWQIANLKQLQKSLSDKSTEYEAYRKRIAAITAQIEAIVNQGQVLELTDKVNINEAELKRLEEFNQRIKDTFGTTDITNRNSLTRKQYRQYLGMVKAFEAEKTDIEHDAETQRRLARINAINEDQKKIEIEGANLRDQTNEYKTLELEKQGIIKQMKAEEIKTNLDANKKILESYKDFSKDLNAILTKILDRIIELNQKKIDAEQKVVENQKQAVDTQERRAEAGLANTLAYEQQALAAREADLAKSERKQQRLEKIKSLYSSYTNYSNKGDENPLAKALRDFAIMEAIAASFGDGGAADDVLAKIPHDGKGIVRGRSHRGRRGGIPVLIEGKEGFFSGREMRNLGKDNFYSIKEAAGMGPVTSDFFTKQRQDFNRLIMPASLDEDAILNGLNDVKKAIQNKPVPSWDAVGIAKGVLGLVETIDRGNTKQRNLYIVKNDRL